MSVSAEYGDEELVSQSRAGNHYAFGQIIARYQCLICSLAYNATGSFSQSEDLAQETFLAAWKHLDKLREPERLRSWLCGIARNIIHSSIRERAREPEHKSESLEAASGAPSPELLPSDQAISEEEEAILWRALERIPNLYREPLILFYREHHSVERVAEALELSEDAVKQRLARGRRMLHEEVTAFVEGALQRTTPGKAFTLGVLAALPLLGASSAAAATAAGTAAEAGLAAKAASTLPLAGAALGPIFGLFGSALGAWFSIKNTRSPRERRFMIRQTWFCAAYVLLFLTALFALIFLGKPLRQSSRMLFDCAMGLLIVSYTVGLVTWIKKSNRRQRQIQIEDGTTLSSPITEGRFPSRSKQLWNVYGSLGGGTAGALAWIVVQAAQHNQWGTVCLTILFGLAVVGFGGHAWMRRPERRVRVIVQALALLGLFTLLICLLHLGEWTSGS